MIKFILTVLIFVLTSDYVVIESYNHNQNYYTQGFLILDGHLYESTGQYGKSKIIIYDLKTMKEKKVISIPSDLFGEGITILNDKLYQLTWKQKKVLVYEAKSLTKIKEFHNYLDGWGLTHNKKNLLMSDGSSYIYEVNPLDFSEVNSIEVYDDNGPVDQINELEYVNGYIYANIYHTNDIVKIDPKSGYIEKRFDISGLLNEKPTRPVDVLNGIAYDENDKSFYLTGKLWPRIYKVKLD